MHRITLRPVLLVALAGTALGVLGLALVLAGGRPSPSGPGLPDAGALTGWTLPTARLLANLAAVGCVGTLLTGAVLAPAGPGRLGDGPAEAVRAARLWAIGWAAAAVLTLILTVSDVAGLPVSHLASSDLARAARALAPVRALVIVVVLALVVVLVAAMARGATAARAGARNRGGGFDPDALHRSFGAGGPPHPGDRRTGCACGGSHGVDRRAARDLLHLRGSGEEQTRAVTRFSTLALVCFSAVTGSGVLAAVTRLGTSVENWTTAYGTVLLLKTVAVIALGAVGWRHRRGTMRALRAGRPRAFWRLATGELVVMCSAMGLAVALSRAAAPSGGGGGATQALVATCSAGGGRTPLPWSPSCSPSPPTCAVSGPPGSSRPIGLFLAAGRCGVPPRPSPLLPWPWSRSAPPPARSPPRC